MNVKDIIKIITDAVNECEDTDEALSWDDENSIKNAIVANNELEKIFSDTESLENMYIYEMFDTTKHNLTQNQIASMLNTWVMELEEFGIYPEVDLPEIS